MTRRNDDEDETSVAFENIIVVPPDGGWGWVVVVAAFYCIFVMDGIANTYGLLLPVFQKEFDASLSEVSLINSLFTGFYFLFGPVASALANRFGFRATIICGSVVSALGIGVSVFNQSVQLMFITYGFVGGLGFSLMYINVLLTVGFYFEKWRALATGITVSASGAGTFSFAPAVQALLASYTWRHVLIGYAALVFLCSPVAVCFRPLAPIKIVSDKTVVSDADSEDVYKGRDRLKKKIHSNINYPTAAEATNMTSTLGSSASLRTNIISSVESLEVRRPSAKEYNHSSLVISRGRKVARSNLDDIASVEESEPQRRFRWVSFICTCQWCRCWGRKKTRPGLRPLYRDDIFCESSVGRMYSHERNTSNRGSIITNSVMLGRVSRISNRSLFYNMSVSRLPTRSDVAEEKDRRFRCCPERILRVLKTMFDFSIIKVPTFLFFLVSTSLLALGALVPVQFSYVRAVEMKIMNKDEASLMLSAIGITNTVGRIICGLLGSIRRVNIVLLHVVFLLFGACLNFCVVFFFDKTVLFIYATLYGFVLAEQGCLRSVILIKLVGLENLTNAFGILLLFLGLFTIVGSPLAGSIKEAADSYDSVFFYSSGILFLSAGVAAPILFWKRLIERRARVVSH